MTENTSTYYPTINQSFWLLAEMLLISIPSSIPIGLFIIFKSHLEAYKILGSLAILITYAITFFWIIRIAKKRIENNGQWEVKWKTQRISISSLVVFGVMTLSTMIIMDPIIELIPMPETLLKRFEDLMRPDIFSFLTVVVLAPVLEELFFRGVILESFLKNYSPWKAILWSAIIFGCAHFNPWQSVGSGLLGILIGWAYVKTNSLVPGIAIHFLNNLISFTAMALSSGNSFYLTDIIDSTLMYSILTVASITALVMGYTIINKKETSNVSPTS